MKKLARCVAAGLLLVGGSLTVRAEEGLVPQPADAALLLEDCGYGVGAFADQPRVRAVEQYRTNIAIRLRQECGYPCRRKLHARFSPISSPSQRRAAAWTGE